jgi:hypothetical protein
VILRNLPLFIVALYHRYDGALCGFHSLEAPLHLHLHLIELIRVLEVEARGVLLLDEIVLSHALLDLLDLGELGDELQDLLGDLAFVGTGGVAMDETA